MEKTYQQMVSAGAAAASHKVAALVLATAARATASDDAAGMRLEASVWYGMRSLCLGPDHAQVWFVVAAESLSACSASIVNLSPHGSLTAGCPAEIVSKGPRGTRKSTVEASELAKHAAGVVSESVSNIFRTRLSGTPTMSRQTSSLPRLEALESQDTPSTWTIDVPAVSNPSSEEDTGTSLTPGTSGPEPRHSSSKNLTKNTIGLALREHYAMHADQQHTPPKRIIAGEGDSTNPVWQGVNLDVYSLGSFQFKGMAGNREIAQVLPSALGARLELFSHVLKRSKATCIRQDDTKLHSVRMWMLDITDMQVAR